MLDNLAFLSINYNRLAKCADERHAVASPVMTAPISKDKAEADAAALFKRLIDASEWTHETFAVEVEVSPGRVSQWATNRGPIPPERAVAVAKLLDTAPELISPGWANLRSQFIDSQVGRLTADIIPSVEMVARKLAELTPGQRLDFTKHADQIAQALRLTILRVFEMSGDANVRTVQRDGEDSRLHRTSGAVKAGGEKPAEVSKPRKRAAGGAKRA